MKKHEISRAKFAENMKDCGGGTIPEDLNKKCILKYSPYTSDK